MRTMPGGTAVRQGRGNHAGASDLERLLDWTVDSGRYGLGMAGLVSFDWFPCPGRPLTSSNAAVVCQHAGAAATSPQGRRGRSG